MNRKGENCSDIRASNIINQVDLEERHVCSNFKCNSGLIDDDSSNDRDGIGLSTFKDYILNKSVTNTPCRRGFKKQPTLKFINLNNQKTRDDEKASIESKACATYLKNYEHRHSSFKFSVTSS